VGDELDLAYTLIRHDPVMRGRSELVAGLAPGPPADRVRLIETWPASKSMRWRQTDGLPTAQVTKAAGGTQLEVDALNVEAPKPPKGAPPRFAFLGKIETTEFTDWSEISSLMSPLYRKAAALRPDSPLKAEVAKIRAATSDPKAQAAMALRLVQDQVRYLYLGMNQGGYVPADADVTWSRRFGDCKGKTALLLALLRELGIDAQPAIVSTVAGDGLDEHLPLVELFDHILVEARIGGKTYWLDGTRSGDRNLDGIRIPLFHWALPVQDAGGRLEPLVAAPLDTPASETRITLDASGGLDAIAPAHVEVIYRGDAATVMNIGLSAAAKSDVEQKLREMWGQQLPWIEVKQVGFTFDDAKDEEHVTMDGAASMSWTLDPDSGAQQYQVDGASLGWTADYTRDPGTRLDAPYAVDFPSYDKAVETIILPQDGKGFSTVGDDVDKRCFTAPARSRGTSSPWKRAPDPSPRSFPHRRPPPPRRRCAIWRM
jgi:hypothetical protein